MQFLMPISIFSLRPEAHKIYPRKDVWIPVLFEQMQEQSGSVKCRLTSLLSRLIIRLTSGSFNET